MSDGFRERILCTGEDGPTLANSAVATSLLPASRKFTLPSYFFDKVGKVLAVRAAGRISTVVTKTGTLTLDIRFASVAVFSSGAMALNIVAKTNAAWLYEAELVCRSIGASTSATLLGMGYWKSHAVIGAGLASAFGAESHVLPYNVAPAAGGGFDSTQAQTIDMIATWSVANSSNSITMHQFALDVYT